MDVVEKTDSSTLEIEHATMDPQFTPEEEKVLVRKIDCFMMPTIWIMYLLSYMDRTK